MICSIQWIEYGYITLWQNWQVNFDDFLFPLVPPVFGAFGDFCFLVPKTIIDLDEIIMIASQCHR